eukprot:jgi/Tetstr1/425529/TSEL_001540.t1
MAHRWTWAQFASHVGYSAALWQAVLLYQAMQRQLAASCTEADANDVPTPSDGATKRDITTSLTAVRPASLARHAQGLPMYTREVSRWLQDPGHLEVHACDGQDIKAAQEEAVYSAMLLRTRWRLHTHVEKILRIDVAVAGEPGAMAEGDARRAWALMGQRTAQLVLPSKIQGQRGVQVAELKSASDTLEACFAQHVLEWNPSIDFYNVSHPERLELHPRCNDSTTWYVDGQKVDCWDTRHSTRGGYLTRHEISASGLKSPDGLSSDHAVLQWMYYTDVGTGEKFWNCADIRIRPSGAPSTPSTPSPTSASGTGGGGGSSSSTTRRGNGWTDANSRCGTSCPSGVDPHSTECPAGERCYADLAIAPCKWPSYECNGGTGACRHVSVFTCYEAPPPGYPTADGCYAGTMHCSKGDGRRKLSAHLML